MQFGNLSALVADDEAVSPVIGVILMVAITVILAAVIGTFVLGLGNKVTQGTAPTADFGFDYDGSGTVTVTHIGGDTIDADQLTVQVNDAVASNQFSGTVSAGSSVDVSASGGDTVRVVWTSEGGGSSQVLASYTVPN